MRLEFPLERLMLIGYSDKGTIAKWLDHFELG
jgi:hypothetical protein